MGLSEEVVLVLLALLVSSSVIIGTLSTTPQKKVCLGTSNGLSQSKAGDVRTRYQAFKDRYKDCAYVDGNMEIVDYGCDDHMSFLRSIEEIAGYLLIATTCTERIPLTSLRIIRGRTLYEAQHPQSNLESNRTRNYSLYVSFNFRALENEEPPDEGLTSLDLASLTEISVGSVLFEDNPLLCFVETIDWTDILSGEGAKAIIEPQVTARSNHCKDCPATCQNGPQGSTRHCWTRQHCQNFTRLICAKQCSGRCFGKEANECCHIECAAGCTGPLSNNCLSCKHFKDADHCVPFCPPLQIYDPATKKHVHNPNGKYAYGSQCVNECPKHMMVDKGACVSDCGRDYYADSERRCTACGAGPCPKSCLGTGDADWVHAKNIRDFVNCTVIQGSLKIQQTTFTGDELWNISELTVNDMSVFENVVEITDYLRVDAQIDELRSLSFLKNLRIIHGRNLDKGLSALHIYDTHLERLDLNSLRQISHGRVLIQRNQQLCYAETFNWKQLLVNANSQTVEIHRNGNASICESNGFVCSEECTADGCMGPGKDQCLNCSNYRFGSTCIASCSDQSNNHHLTVHPNSTGLECTTCHEECHSNCTGVGSHQCDRCRHFKDGPNCVRSCSSRQYADTNAVCQPCSPLCIEGCNGPDAARSANGCKDCEHIVHRTRDEPECLAEDTDCPPDYFRLYKPNATPKTECHQCHSECLSCNGFGPRKCQACRHFQQDGSCVASCSSANYYVNSDRQCHKCHDECIDCHGPTAADCLSCRLYVVYENYEHRKPDSKFNCTDVCPEFAPNRLRDGNATFCVQDDPDRKKLVAIIAGTICGAVFFVGFLAVIILILRRQVARAEEKKLRLTAKISGFVECEPLTPSSAKPDMSVLRLIKESDLRRSGIIGSGAFGTVYKGLWVPEGENVKIPVAIKILQEGADENDNLLEEARIMASVLHPSCLHILAVCMTAQVMLVTQLMPLGCLLDYVRKHRDNIGSKVILNWCTQIARGMSYLEERGIIHRDLAARNVLVHSPSHVKITDFGLAKLVNEDGRFLSTGGKLPIKWLALECIRNRIFTHKSDVWSFGVTVWELCTYGQRPYESVNAGDIVNLLEKGERLPQPSICTIDVYMIMIKCWMLGAESRPSFSELSEEFAKMARDPGRYLVIPNDKLMRLPSQPADSRELLRHVSLTLDGPEEVIMADEYANEHAKKTRFKLLDKHPRDGRQAPIDEEAARPTLISPSEEGGSDYAPMSHDSKGHKDSKGQDSKSPNSRARLVPHLELAAVQNRLSSYEPNRDSPRYSPDPCSMPYQAAFPNNREDATDGEQPASDGSSPLVLPSGSVKKEGLVAAEALRIPLDGSDYLQPRSLVPTSYLELVDYGGTEEFIQGDYSPDPQRKDTLPDEQTSLLSQTTAIDNPEYFQQPTNTTPLLLPGPIL